MDGRTLRGSRHGDRPAVALRNLAIGVHRQGGGTNIAAALRHAARDYHRTLSALGLIQLEVPGTAGWPIPQEDVA